MHPPGGATAVTAIIGGTTIHNLGYAFVIMPIFFKYNRTNRHWFDIDETKTYTTKLLHI
jgi:hypothetical protein